MDPRKRPSLPLWLKALVFGVILYLSAIASWWVAARDGSNVSFWMPAGFYLTALLLSPTREWAALLFGGLIFNMAFDLTLGTPLGMTFIYAAVNVLQALTGAALYRYFITRSPRLKAIRDFLGLVACSAVVASGSWSILTAWFLVVLGQGAAVTDSWIFGWTGNAMAILTVAPALLIWFGPGPPWNWRLPPRRIGEALVMVGGICIVSWYLFVAGGGVGAPDNFVLISFVLWAAVRFGIRGVSAINLLLALLLVYFASHYPKGLPLEQAASTAYVTKLYLFLAICSLIGLIPAIALGERDRLVAQLGDSEERFRNLAAAANEGVFNTEDGKILDVNDQGLRLFGYDHASEMVGLEVISLTTPDTRDLVSRAIADDLETPYGHRLMRRDGTVFDAEAQARVMRRGSRKIRMTAVRDVTKRKQEESLLNGQYRVLEMIAIGKPLLEILTALIGVVESQSDQTFASVMLADGDVLRFFAAPSLPVAFNLATSRVMVDEKSGSCGTAARRRQPVFVADIATDPLWESYAELAGVHGLGACWSTPIFDGKGRLLGTFALYHRQPGLPTPAQRQLIDTATHTASVAISRHQDEAALKLSDFSVNQASTPTVWVTQDSLIRRVNRATCEMVAIEEAELLGKSVLDLIPDFTMEGWRNYWREARLRRRMRFESAQRRPDGTPLILDIDMNFFEFEGREYQFFFLDDVTDRRQLEEKLRQSQKMEAVGQLSGGIAHDFNNLLTVIQGNLGMIRLSGIVPPGIAESVEEINSAIGRATKLTTQLLAFGRKQVMQSHDIDLNEVVESFSRMLRRVIGETIEVSLRFHSGGLSVRADRSMLEQVLLNLCLNARDAMPKGGQLALASTIVDLVAADAERMPASRPGRFACLAVTDTGTGITPENLKRVFEPFFTTKEVGKGTGLGLASVYGILQQHQGWATVKSEVGRGSTFVIYLPLLSRLPELRPPVRPAPAFPGGDETILLVEDDTAVRLVATKALNMMGYRVLVASNGVEAVEKWERHRAEIQLLLTDMVMPGEFGGADIARMFRAQEPALKVIFMSGYSADLAGTNFDSAGGHHFLGKPFEITELAETLRRCLRAD